MPRKRKQTSTKDTNEPPTKKTAVEPSTSTSPVLLPIASSAPVITQTTPTNLERFVFSRRAVKEICGADDARFERGQDIGTAYSVHCKISDSPLRLKFTGKVPGTHKSFYRCSVIFNRLHVQHEEHVVTWNCNCPDWGNPCKHIIALCLQWKDSESDSTSKN